MKNFFRSSISIALVLSMIMSVLCLGVAAADPLVGDKTAEHIDADKYGVTVQIPGGDGVKTHEEIILMVDGSYSMDNEWPAMKEAINLIGQTVLNGTGDTQLTLMAFGMGDNEVLVHVKDAKELAAALGELPGNLLYGRSSTNCEAGFTGVAEYIANHDDTLRSAQVIFISDGNVNTDETPRVFDTNWKKWTRFGALTVAQVGFEETLSYGTNLPEAFGTVFGNRFEGASFSEIIERAFAGEVTNEEFLAFADQVWADVYAYSGLTPGAEYPVSDAERAFVKYDKEKGTYIQDIFYYTTYKSSYVTYPNRVKRTPVAADALAAMDKVAAMYVVDYDGYTAWMDTGIKSEKSTFIKSNGIAGLCEALKSVLSKLSLTPYNDVVVYDYMSKWVNLLPETIKVVDADGRVVAEFDEENSTKDENGNYTEFAYKWVGEALCKDKAPIVLDLIPEEDYEDGGVEVIGNESGLIFRITWNIKDGPLYRKDAYSLKYEVTVDYDEPGIRFDEDLPTNGNTDVEYTDEDGDTIKDPIKVPEIIVEEPEAAEVELFGTKFFNGLRGEGFSFALEHDGKIVETAVSDKNGNYSFETLYFCEEGVYKYSVYEVKGEKTNILYDERVYDITVSVVRIADNYVADVTVKKNGLHFNGDTSGLVFRNRSIVPTSITIDGTKYLDGKKNNAEGFIFALLDESGNEIARTESDSKGYFEFTIEYTSAGEYSYTVVEINDGREEIEYDDAEYEVIVTVELKNTKLKASEEVVGVKNGKIEFYNTTKEEETTAPETTEPETTEPVETEDFPEESTDVPLDPTPETTEPAPETTEPAPETTEPAPETTEPAPETTEPEPEESEDIPEETTNVPLDPTPDTTEPAPETTEPAPETTEPAPETTESEDTTVETDQVPDETDPSDDGVNPDTGDNGIYFIILAAICVISLAAIATKKENVED